MKGKQLNRKGALIRICEIYASLQGEGLLTGTPSIFVRTSGCNLRCWFCDTPFASWAPEGEHWTIERIVEKTLALNVQHVVITGGEPMIHPSLVELCERLHANGKHLTIETAGTVYQRLHCDLISISPKLKGSTPTQASENWIAAHEARRNRPDIVQRLMDEQPYQLKFVVDTLADAKEVLFYLQQLTHFDTQRVLLMPQGTCLADLNQRAEWLIPWCDKHSLRYCPRAHIQWFGNQRGT
jgi:7-carboxy-7-deazaguanine synthase